jgi:hypothetical protein
MFGSIFFWLRAMVFRGLGLGLGLVIDYYVKGEIL